MPTVLRIDGWRVVIYPNDHAPAHVHVLGPGWVVVVNLTGKAATRPDTYRSFGLRFAVKRRSETTAAFRARVNAAQEKDDSDVGTEADCWLLGQKAIQAGSLHCDLWRGHAVDLAGHDRIAVFPVGGWWKSHTGQRRSTDKGRYALVISISAPGQPRHRATALERLRRHQPPEPELTAAQTGRLRSGTPAPRRQRRRPGCAAS